MASKPTELFCRNVRAVLRSKGMTMEELAKAVGTKQPSISRLLAGGEGISIDRAEKIATAIGVSLSALLSENFEILKNSSLT